MFDFSGCNWFQNSIDTSEIGIVGKAPLEESVEEEKVKLGYKLSNYSKYLYKINKCKAI